MPVWSALWRASTWRWPDVRMRGSSPDGENVARQFHSGHPGHRKVADDDAEVLRLSLKGVESVRGARERGGQESETLQQVGADQAHAVLVVDKHDLTVPPEGR